MRFWPRRGRRAELVCQPWPGPPEPLPGSSWRRDGDVWTDALVEYTEPLPVVQTAPLTTPGQWWRANGVAVAEAARVQAHVQAAVAQHVRANGGRPCW